MKTLTLRLPGLCAALLCAMGGRAVAAQVSEQDYFSELPEVLTVTRLAQPLSETPGAVTILDREMIRRSGARELADLLRLVPGYFVSGWNGANPGAVYHAPIDDYGTRNLIMVDGRSVYSSFQIGDTHRGMMGVLLEDIDRIEVLRGSNSAAYGANAMFGVINIVTRHASDTQGTEVSVTGGEGGIGDSYARIGWGDENAGFRITTGRRQDHGYRNVHDDKIVSQLHFRGDLRPSSDQDLMLAAGVYQISAGEGFPLGSAKNKLGGNQLRTIDYQDLYLHGQWRQQLGGSDEVKLTASFNEENIRDESRYVFPPVMIDSGGRGRRVNVEFQHQHNMSKELRAVWGLGYKREDAISEPLYAVDTPVVFDEKRLFGNLEWKPDVMWTLNLGGFWGDHSHTGDYFSPRLMANLHVMPDHTLRMGITRSVRPPTLFETKADVRYYFGGGQIAQTYLARGNLKPETLYSQEIGYFGNFRDWRLTLDVRAYQERMKDPIRTTSYDPLPWVDVKDYINHEEGFKVQGLEYQLRWKPVYGTEIWVNQTFQHLNWDDDWDNHLPPTHATTLALFQKLPLNLDLSLMFHSIGAMTWRTDDELLAPRRRVDVRLAYPFRMGSTRAEASVTVQAANGDYLEFLPSQNFKVERRAFGTLRLEF